MPLTITSTAFIHGQAMPRYCTCEGANSSPPLAWIDIPPTAKSLVLIVDDPDAPDPRAPQMTWVHWLLYNLPVTCTELASGIQTLPQGTLEGINDWMRTGYGGPCPPIGQHRYCHKLYALDIVLPDLNKPNKAKLEQAMQGHVLAESVLVGTYQKSSV